MSRVYSPREKSDALAYLAAEGGNLKRAAISAGVPRKTLEYWARGKGINAEVLRMVEESKLKLRDMFRDEAEAALEEAKGKRGAANYKDLMIGAAVAVDKAQLLSGEPTNITRTARQTAEEALETLWQLAREEAERRGEVITREMVRERLCERRPALRPLLTPAPQP